LKRVKVEIDLLQNFAKFASFLYFRASVSAYCYGTMLGFCLSGLAGYSSKKNPCHALPHTGAVLRASQKPV
jgi:hypothetical protein